MFGHDPRYGGWKLRPGSPYVCGESDNGLGVSYGFSDTCSKNKYGNSMANSFEEADTTCLGVGARARPGQLQPPPSI